MDLHDPFHIQSYLLFYILQVKPSLWACESELFTIELWFDICLIPTFVPSPFL